MGNTAKLMLVGVLALVIVIAVVWDRQSSDLEKTAAVTNGMDDSGETLSPTLAEAEAETTGTMYLQQEIQEDPLIADLKREYLGLPKPAEGQNQPVEVVNQQEETPQEAPREVPKARSYIVKSAESFWTIARRGGSCTRASAARAPDGAIIHACGDQGKWALGCET